MTAGDRIAVLGAGYIGMAVAHACAAAGASVWAVRRRARPKEAGVELLAGDLLSGVIPELPAALDAVVLTVAPSGDADSYEKTYPLAARTAVALARTTGARALVYTSSTGVYGGRDGASVDESSPRLGEGPGNRALIEAEDILLGAGLGGVTVLRVAGIYGPGRDPRGRFAEPGLLPLRGEYWVNLAHQADVVAAIMASLSHAGPPRALNVSDGTPATAADIARWCAADRGHDPAALVFDGEAQLNRSNQRVSNAALVATGWRARFPSFRGGFSDGLQKPGPARPA